MFVTPRDVRYYIGMLVSEPIEVFISFYVDWSLLHNNALLWTPQLRIMNFWPESRRMAPERPPGVGDGNVMEAEAAASLVEDDFWRSVETQFRGLRTRCGIREANLGGFVPPCSTTWRPLQDTCQTDRKLISTWSDVSRWRRSPEKRLGHMIPKAWTSREGFWKGTWLRSGRTGVAMRRAPLSFSCWRGDTRMCGGRRSRT